MSRTCVIGALALVMTATAWADGVSCEGERVIVDGRLSGSVILVGDSLGFALRPQDTRALGGEGARVTVRGRVLSGSRVVGARTVVRFAVEAPTADEVARDRAEAIATLPSGVRAPDLLPGLYETEDGSHTLKVEREGGGLRVTLDEACAREAVWTGREVVAADGVVERGISSSIEGLGRPPTTPPEPRLARFVAGASGEGRLTLTASGKTFARTSPWWRLRPETRRCLLGTFHAHGDDDAAEQRLHDEVDGWRGDLPVPPRVVEAETRFGALTGDQRQSLLCVLAVMVRDGAWDLVA